MDTIARAALIARQSPQTIGSVFRSSLRPAPDARVDVAEIQESTRVSFTGGAAVATSRNSRDAIHLYQWVQSL